MCEKFHDDRLRNDRALGIENLDNNNPKNKHNNNVAALGDPFPGPKLLSLIKVI